MCYNVVGDKVRLKNIKGAKEKVETSKYVLMDYLKYKKKFQTIFKNDNPIHIEIGMGKGDFIIGMAKLYPGINFIGIEKFDSVLVKAIEKLEKVEIPNLFLIKMDATDIVDVFSEEIDTLYLNFSDPWPKNRHEHRRLSSAIFLKRYDLLFKDKCHIIMKTDNRHLFEYSVISFWEFGYNVSKLFLDYHKEDREMDIETEYERKFSNKGPIYKIEVNKWQNIYTLNLKND